MLFKETVPLYTENRTKLLNMKVPGVYALSDQSLPCLYRRYVMICICGGVEAPHIRGLGTT
jgi:hypothetical protein